MHETPLDINTDTLISGSYKPQSQDFPAWTEANFTHPQGYSTCSCCGVDKLKDMSLQAPRAQRGLKSSTLAMVIDINSTQLSHDDFEADMWAKIALLVPWKEISTRQ